MCGGGNNEPPPTLSPDEPEEQAPAEEETPDEDQPSTGTGEGPNLNPPSERNDNASGVDPNQPRIGQPPEDDAPNTTHAPSEEDGDEPVVRNAAPFLDLLQPNPAAEFDPGIVTHTIYFDKEDTKDIATGGAAASAACASVGLKNAAAAVACGAGGAALTYQANRALNRNMCVKIKFIHTGAAWPDIYDGDQCK